MYLKTGNQGQVPSVLTEGSSAALVNPGGPQTSFTVCFHQRSLLLPLCPCPSPRHWLSHSLSLEHNLNLLTCLLFSGMSSHLHSTSVFPAFPRGATWRPQPSQGVPSNSSRTVLMPLAGTLFSSLLLLAPQPVALFGCECGCP